MALIARLRRSWGNKSANDVVDLCYKVMVVVRKGGGAANDDIGDLHSFVWRSTSELHWRCG